MKIDDFNVTNGIPTEFNQYSVSGSYQPVTGTETKTEKKSVTKKMLAWVCAICVILSGAFGFGGTYLANRLTASEPAAQNIETPAAEKSSSSSPVVIYKAADTVNTSAGNLAASGDEMTYAQAAALVKDSVVEINTEYTTRNSWFQYTTGGAGSGVILSEDGYTSFLE